MKFTNAIVRTPGRSLVDGLTTAGLGKPDYEMALGQHRAYIRALEQCELDVRVLPPDEAFPDSTFVEDTALLTPHCAIIMNPGAPSRRGEIVAMQDVLKDYYPVIDEVRPPGTVEAGDIMRVGSHYYIGLSQRTNENGAAQVIRILQKYGMDGTTVPLKSMLHLKTGVAYLENDNLVTAGEFISDPIFQNFNRLEIRKNEAYAANCIWMNDRVLIPAGYPKAKETIQSAGYEIMEVDVSEFRKLDGGLSCLSLRF